MRREMPVKLKLEEIPTNLGNEIKQGKVLSAVYYHRTLTCGGVSGGIAWPSGSWEEKKISLGPSGNSTPIARSSSSWPKY
jgi:hypothetical protein